MVFPQEKNVYQIMNTFNNSNIKLLIKKVIFRDIYPAIEENFWFLIWILRNMACDQYVIEIILKRPFTFAWKSYPNEFHQDIRLFKNGILMANSGMNKIGKMGNPMGRNVGGMRMTNFTMNGIGKTTHSFLPKKLNKFIS